MRPLEPLRAKNLETGETREISIDPRFYTSVHDWKPVPPERFTQLLHHYGTLDQNFDEHGHGLMTVRALPLSPGVSAIIHYSVKEPGSPVSSPVLMTVNYETTRKTICFASLTYGEEADPERRHD